MAKALLTTLALASLACTALLPSSTAQLAYQGVVTVDGLVDCAYAEVVGAASWRIDVHTGGTVTSFFFTTAAPGGQYSRCGFPDCGIINDPLIVVGLYAKGPFQSSYTLVNEMTVPCAP